MINDKKIKRVEIIVHGRVHGVSFRYYTREMAERLNLLGWARNEPEGSVKIIAQGKNEDLSLLIEWAKEGPRHAQVEKIETRWLEAGDDLRGFEVRH